MCHHAVLPSIGDSQAARELALYFSDPRATLAKFVLSKADVDDFEVTLPSILHMPRC